MTPEEEIHRAQKSREILNNPLWVEAFRDIEKALLEGITRSAFTDSLLREKLCQRLACLHDLRAQLEQHIDTGKLAQGFIERAKEKLGL